MTSPLTAVSPIPGFKFILGGPAGAGKTTSLRSLTKLFPHVRALFVDPNYSPAIEGPDGIKDWRYINPYGNKWDILIKNANMINTMSNEAMQKMQGMNNADYRQFLDILSCCNNFVTQDGRQFGDIGSWGTDVCLVIDGLSGLSKASATLTVGAKPVRSQPDWGVMMSNLENFLETLTGSCWCHIVLVAHLEPEIDEYTGRGGRMRVAAPRRTTNAFSGSDQRRRCGSAQIRRGASRGIARRSSRNATLRCSSENTGSSTPIMRPTSPSQGPAALMSVGVAMTGAPPAAATRTARTRPPETSTPSTRP